MRERDRDEGKEKPLLSSNTYSRKQSRQVGTSEETMKRCRRIQSDGRALGIIATSSSFNSLPTVIIEDILTRLPVKSLVRYRCLCKYWFNQLTTNSVLVKTHLCRTIQNEDNHAFILQNRVLNEYFFVPNGTFEQFVKMDNSCMDKLPKYLHMVGSSDGMICLCHDPQLSTYSPLIYLWNPATREFKTLPPPCIQVQKTRDIITMVALGFGFVPNLYDYKVVRFVSTHTQSYRFGSEVEVYSLRDNCWKILEKTFPFGVIIGKCQAVLDGVAHFAVVRTFQREFESDYIISFDMAEEEFHEVPLPDIVIPQYYRIKMLQTRVFKGCLFLLVKTRSTEVEIWLMKEYGVKKSWTKLSTTEIDQIGLYVINFRKNKEILFLKGERTLVSYNSETRRLTRIQISQVGEGYDWKDGVPYVETLVPLATCSQVFDGQQPNNSKVTVLS